MPIHAYRLVYSDSPHAPEMLWEWEQSHVGRLLSSAKTFGREVVQCDFSDWEALAQENQRIWERYYLPRPAYQPWDTWRVWLEEYRGIVRDVQDIAEEHHGRRCEDKPEAPQTT